MKAQTVKNAVIVPVGAKGGFVVKRPPAEGGREALQQEVVACYKTLIRGMLDITDNISGDEVVPPVGGALHVGGSDGENERIVAGLRDRASVGPSVTGCILPMPHGRRHATAKT